MLPIVDRYDHVFSRKGHHVFLIWDLIDFHASWEGPGGHETLHDVIVPELVLDVVGVVRASLFKEPLKVVCLWPCLTLATALDRHDVFHARAAHLRADATINVGRGRRLLAALLAPLLATFGVRLGILDGDIEWHSPAAAQDWAKLSHLVADGVLGGTTAPLLGGVLEGVGRCLKRP
jgi:hypothetical protein